MLKKLLKYDLQKTYKILIIFYSLSIFFAILTRIFLSIENSFILNIIGKICGGVTISMIFNILINNLIRLWVDFKNNLYKDESYLTHTLPIEKKTLYLSKTLTAIITLFTSILIIGLSLFIAYYSKENIELLKTILFPIANMYNSTILGVLLSILFIFFLEIFNGLQAGYTGIILGHKMNNAKTGFSVLYGLLSYMAIQVFGLLVIFAVGIFNKDIMNLFITSEIVSIDIIKTIIYMSLFTYSIVAIINYIINLKIFKKGVNVD